MLSGLKHFVPLGFGDHAAALCTSESTQSSLSNNDRHTLTRTPSMSKAKAYSAFRRAAAVEKPRLIAGNRAPKIILQRQKGCLRSSQIFKLHMIEIWMILRRNTKDSSPGFRGIPMRFIWVSRIMIPFVRAPACLHVGGILSAILGTALQRYRALSYHP